MMIISTFDEFKNYYALTMFYYQCIEHDVKLIYAFMRKGDINDNFDDVEKNTLGSMIVILEKLDYSDDKPYISRGDYKFLKAICDRRNYWAHQAFIDFAYIKDFTYSKEYKRVCDSLIKDYKEVKRASGILEKMRIEFCDKHAR